MLTSLDGPTSIYDVTNPLMGDSPDFGSVFFPTPQVGIMPSDFILGANSNGRSCRLLAPDAPSMFETAVMQTNDWLGTPYEGQYSVTAQRDTGARLDSMVSMTTPGVFRDPSFGLSDLGYARNFETEDFSKSWGDNIVDFFGGVTKGATNVLGEATKISTAVDQFATIFGTSTREVIYGTPRAGSPEGRNEAHSNQQTTSGADVTMVGKIYGAAIDQVKGLYGLAFSGPGGAQRVQAIPVAAGITAGTALLIGGVILAIYLIRS